MTSGQSSFSRTLNADWSIQISEAPAVYKMIPVVHTGDYAVIQVKHRRDINFIVNLFKTDFCSEIAIFGTPLENLIA